MSQLALSCCVPSIAMNLSGQAIMFEVHEDWKLCMTLETLALWVELRGARPDRGPFCLLASSWCDGYLSVTLLELTISSLTSKNTANVAKSEYPDPDRRTRTRQKGNPARIRALVESTGWMNLACLKVVLHHTRGGK